MNRRGFIQVVLATAVAPHTPHTVGSTRGLLAPEIELDINADSWSAGWPETKRVNMEYANAHQETNGRQLEFAFAQHSRAAGDHTSVRWTDFTADGPPTQGYYWSERDKNIRETDNLPTLYQPDGHIFLVGMKIIDIRAPAAIFRNNDGSGTSFGDKVEIALLNGATTAMWRSNYNPACLVNPYGDCPPLYFGGGYYKNYSGGAPPSMKILARNPDYPRKSDKPWLLTATVYGTASTPFPIYARHAVKIGNWVYWGGAGVSNDLRRTREFYRIYVPGLADGRRRSVDQERISDLPSVTGMPGARFSLNCADVRGKKLIHVNSEGVWRYHVPHDDGPDGIWEGPYTFGIANWAATISGGCGDGKRGDWHGFIGTHRSDLNQTFFRYNLSRRWNRIRWPFPRSG